jgi:hypothetical protein
VHTFFDASIHDHLFDFGLRHLFLCSHCANPPVTIAFPMDHVLCIMVTGSERRRIDGADGFFTAMSSRVSRRPIRSAAATSSMRLGAEFARIDHPISCLRCRMPREPSG